METYISYLRRKVDAGHVALIHTVRGVGYTLRLSSQERSRGREGGFSARGARRPAERGVVCLTTVCLLAFGGAGAILLHRHLLQEVDTRLDTILDAPVGGPRLPPTPAPKVRAGPPPACGEGASPPPFPTDLRRPTLGTDGKVLDVVGRTDSDDLGALGPRELRDRAGEPFTVPSSAGGSRWRVVTDPLADGTVAVAAKSLAEVDGTLTRLLLIEAGVGAVLLGLLGVVARSHGPPGSAPAGPDRDDRAGR